MNIRHLAAPSCAAILSTLACGSAGGDGLFTRHDVASGSGGLPGYGGAGPFYGTGGTAGGGGGAPFGGGGSPFSNGGSSNGGFSNGGFSNGGGGGLGLGGTSGSGGISGSGGTSPASCDYSGTWGSYIQAPVSWPATPFILDAGTGALQQWNLTIQVQEGLDVRARTVPCMIYLPDLQSSLFGGFAKFGIRFPEAIFDQNTIPVTEFVLKGSIQGGTFSFATDPFAITVGLTLANASTVSWPGTHSLDLQDHDLDGNPGITVIPAVDQGYSQPPVDAFATGRADLIFIAERTVSKLYGPLTDCNEVHGSVDIVSLNGKPGIDSSVVGCHVNGGSTCTQTESDFIDSNRPQYTPTGPGTIIDVRLPDGATCADVRARFPLQ